MQSPIRKHQGRVRWLYNSKLADVDIGMLKQLIAFDLSSTEARYPDKQLRSERR